MSNATDEIRHVVGDGSPDPECVDDCPGCAATEQGPVGFYVTVRDGRRSGALLGPYDTHPEALANVDRAKAYAEQVNDRAVWYAYGTAKVTMKPGRGLRPGTFNDHIGLTVG